MPLTGTFMGAGIAPQVIAVAALSRRRVRVDYSEAMAGALGAAASYTITHAAGSAAVAVTSVAIDPAPHPGYAILTLDADLTPGTNNYTLEVGAAVTDLAGNPIDEAADGMDFSGPPLALPSSPAGRVTLAQAIARRGGQWVIFVRFQGLGEVGGQYSFCSARPAYAAGDLLWQPLLSTFPKTLTEKVNHMGGSREAGAYTFQLVDVDDFLTSLLRWDADPATTLLLDLDNDDLTMTVTAEGNLRAVPGPVWIGNEAIIISSVFAGVATIIRGAFGTEASAHAAGDPIRAFTTRLEGRELDLYLVPFDAASDTEKLLIDSYTVQKVGYSDDWTDYTFETVSRLMGMLRVVGELGARRLQLVQAVDDRFLIAREVGGALSTSSVWGHGGQPEDRYFRIDGKEFVRANDGNLGADQNLTTILYIQGRAMLGSSRLDLAQGTPLISMPLVAFTGDGLGSFRISPDGSTSRTAGTWIQTTHWVDIILCLWLSSRRAGDGLELVNFNPGETNYSSLEVGWGAGIKRSRINLEACLRVKARTPDWLFPFFTLDGPEKLYECIDKNFLTPLGAFVSTRDGLLEIVLPRLPFAGVPAPALDATNLLQEPKRRGTARAKLTGSFNAAAKLKGVLFHLSGPNGEIVDTLIATADFAGQFGPRDSSTNDADGVLEISVPGLRADQSGIQSFLEEISARKALRFLNPPLEVDAWAQLSEHATALGDLRSLSFEGAPDHRRGVRGLTNMVMSVTERAINLDVRHDQPGFRFLLLGYGQLAPVGIIAPSSSMSAFDAGTFVATIVAQRYTDVAGDALDLPDADIEQWEIGMRCKLINPNGTLASPAAGPTRFQTIQAINLGANTVTFDGNWGGAGAADLVLVLDDYDAARLDDQALYVAFADEHDRTIGSSTRTAWGYGEP